MSILDLFKKAPKPDNLRTSENPQKYADIAFANKSSESKTNSNMSPKSMTKTSSGAGAATYNKILPSK